MMNDWITKQVPTQNLQTILNNLEEKEYEIHTVKILNNGYAYIIAKKELKNEN